MTVHEAQSGLRPYTLTEFLATQYLLVEPHTSHVGVGCRGPLSQATEIKGTTLRTKSSINRLNMYRGGHAIRNKKGRIVHGGAYNDKNSTGGKIVKNMGSAVARTAPNRRWFGNTRIINPKQLDKFREEMGAKVNDPYTVVLRTRKLPMGLLSDTKKTAQMNLLSTESFESVFETGKLATQVQDISVNKHHAHPSVSQV